MQPILFILGFLNLIGTGLFIVMGKTNTDLLTAAIAWLAFLLCLAALGIIAAIERASESNATIAGVLNKIMERRAAK
jgi:hypothetical protein